MKNTHPLESSSTALRFDARCQMPKCLHLNSELFSSYKNHTTRKGLIGISPGGVFTFISQLYRGHISDREIVMQSGYLNMQFDRGDSGMADKGFTIQHLLPLGVYISRYDRNCKLQVV